MTQRILIIDDSLEVARSTALLFELEGFSVETAITGASGLQLVETSGPFDAIVLDRSLPDMRGEQVMEQIHEKLPNQPVVLISGFLPVKSPPRPQVRSVHKPFDFSKLLATINDMLVVSGEPSSS